VANIKNNISKKAMELGRPGENNMDRSEKIILIYVSIKLAQVWHTMHHITQSGIIPISGPGYRNVNNGDMNTGTETTEVYRPHLFTQLTDGIGSHNVYER
jgi:hypothetical protein